jgi:hypothetical protein
MKNIPFEKDLYAVLGVQSSASIEEIKRSYHARARITHPDRFDPVSQKRDWEKANEMLTELNVAYSILSDINNRNEYDKERGIKSAESKKVQNGDSDVKTHGDRVFNLDDIMPMKQNFSDLPAGIKIRLVQRMEGKLDEQILVMLDNISSNYLFSTILQFWYWYLGFSIDDKVWSPGKQFWYCIVTILVSLLIAKNVFSMIRWRKTVIHPAFVATPLYYIITDFDFVEIYPLWSMRDFKVTHHNKNGNYDHSDVSMKFSDKAHSMTIHSADLVNSLIKHISRYEKRAEAAFKSNNLSYFANNNEFRGILNKNRDKFEGDFKDISRVLLISASILGAMTFLFSRQLNLYNGNTGWNTHETPQVVLDNIPVEGRDIATSSQKNEIQNYPKESSSVELPPEKPIPATGAIKNFTRKKRIAPFGIQASTGKHFFLKLTDTSNGKAVMAVFVRSGTTVNVDVPLGTYDIKYASGDKWYGYKYLFGPNTTYEKADRTLTFQILNNQIEGYTITLYQVANGNLSTTTLAPEEF